MKFKSYNLEKSETEYFRSISNFELSNLEVPQSIEIIGISFEPYYTNLVLEIWIVDHPYFAGLSEMFFINTPFHMTLTNSELQCGVFSIRFRNLSVDNKNMPIINKATIFYREVENIDWSEV